MAEELPKEALTMAEKLREEPIISASQSCQQ